MTGPMIIGLLSIVLFNLADTYFLGQKGTDELAAMGFIFPVVIFLGTVARAIGMGTSSVLSRSIGEGDFQRVRRVTTDSLVLGLAVGIAMAAIGLVSIDPLFYALGARSEQVRQLIYQYMVIWYPGMIFLMVPMVGNQAMRASGDTFWPSVVMIVSAGLNILLDPILIFGWGPIPEMGITGAAIATVFARLGSLVAALSLLHCKKRMLARPSLSIGRMWASWRAVLVIGIPAGATQVLFPVSRAVLTRFMSAFGKPAVAAFGAGMRVEALALLVIWSLATVLLPVVGQNFGAAKRSRIRRASQVSVVFSVAWGLLCWGIFLLVARNLAGVFSDDQAVVEHLTRYFWIVPASYALRGVFIVNNSELNGLHRPLTAGALNVIRMAGLIIPLAYLGARMGRADGLLIALAGANILGGLISWIWTLVVQRRVLESLAGGEDR
jgi:putative MATE family efflux protein